MNFFKVSVLLFLFSFVSNQTMDLFNHFLEDKNSKITLEKESSEDESTENEKGEKEELMYFFSNENLQTEANKKTISLNQKIYSSFIQETIHFPFEAPYSPPEFSL